MRSKTAVWGFIFLFICLFTLPSVTFADKGGSDDDKESEDHHESKSFKHTRYYPSEYYYKKKVASSHSQPKQKSYYYYDVHPEKSPYFGDERTIIINNPDYLSLTSIANMASQGLPDAVIIDEIERTRSFYDLDLETLTFLRQNGVNQKVINFMRKKSRKKTAKHY